MTVDIPQIFQQLQPANKQLEAVLMPYLYVLTPNLFPKRQLPQLQTCHKAGAGLALSLMTCG